jgi:hypothetical protein
MYSSERRKSQFSANEHRCLPHNEVDMTRAFDEGIAWAAELHCQETLEKKTFVENSVPF